MKKLALVLSLLVLAGSTGIAAADQDGWSASGPRVSASISLPGMHLVFGNPNVYCRYQGHYYNRAAWNRFYNLQRERFQERSRRDDDRGYNRDDRGNRDYGTNSFGRRNDGRDQNRNSHQDGGRD